MGQGTILERLAMALVGAATAGEAADAFAAAEGSGDAGAAREAVVSEGGTPVAKSMPIAPKLKRNAIGNRLGPSGFPLPAPRRML